MKKYSKAERLSFKKGMQAQYSKEHPLMKYVVYTYNTTYNGNGSKREEFTGRMFGFRTKKQAVAAAKNVNDRNALRNARVMKAVKSKKVNADDSLTIYGRWKKVKPFRGEYQGD